MKPRHHTKSPVQEVAGRLDFVRSMGQWQRDIFMNKLKRAAKQAPKSKAYRFRRIYVSIVKLGKLPNTREFPQLMWKTQLDVDPMIDELRELYEFLMPSSSEHNPKI